MTTAIKRPERLFSFTDWTKSHPKDQQPGDRLDAMFIELADAIRSTQDALAEIRRDDGGLRSQLSADDIVKRVVKEILAQTQLATANVASIAAGALENERNAQFFAQDAERALQVMTRFVSDWNAIRTKVALNADYVQRTAGSVDVYASESENWANYSHAQADNAIAAKDEALQWAEYLSGPVVNAAEAPDYISGSKYPGGYFYNPVDGANPGLWSAKWWALQARYYAGGMSAYYLGPFDSPPLPGQIDPVTGVKIPNPIPVGTLYYDTASEQLMIWDGTQWNVPVTFTASFRSNFVYQATAGQTTFSGADFNGQTPAVGNYPSDVHLNGVRLIPDEDYDINATTSTLTLNTPATAGSMLQWDLLVSANDLGPGAVNAFKILPLTPDGTAQDFTLEYADPDTGTPTLANVGDGVELMVSIDGCVQESGADFTASGASLHLMEAPPADAKLWAVWYQPGTQA